MGRFMPIACVTVGLGMAAGFGSIGVESVLDYRAFPSAPTPITVAKLAAMAAVPRGTWVRVVDARPDCSRGYASPHGTAYALVGDGKTPFVVIAAVSGALSCEQLARRELTGVPSLRRTVESAPGKDLPDGLAWRGVDWQQWPEHRAVILWTWSGPQNSRTGIWLGFTFAALGLFVTWYGVRWLLPKMGDAVAVDPAQFPSTVQLARRTGSTMPATVVWLPVLRVQAVTARGLATDVTLYELQTPATVSPLATRKPPTLSAHTGPGMAGLIFRTPERDAVAAARPAGSEELVLIRSDLAQLELSKESRIAMRARQLRSLERMP